MPLALTCSCGHELTVELGQTVDCPRCGKPMKAPLDFGQAGTRPITAPDTGNPDGTFDTRKSVASRAFAAAESVRPTFEFLSPPRNADELGWLGEYKVVKLLGQGGMGMVFEARDMKLDRSIALKVMRPEVSRDPEFRQRFMREARATAAVNSDHIVMIHQIGEQNEVVYLAMEFLQGDPLDRWLEKHGQASVPEILRLGADIARGLSAAHEKGHIHRDIKPANIWVEPSGRVKILDFGLARPTRDQKTQLTQAGLIMGTPEYMAPEQAEGAPVDERCDLFSLGCVLYELATNEQAFKGANTMAVLKAVALKDPKPVDKINPEVPDAFVNLVKALLAKKPEDRPSTAREVYEVLDALRHEGEGKALPTRSAARLKQWQKTSNTRRGLIAAGIAGLALLGVGYFSGFLVSKNEDKRRDTSSGAAATTKPFKPDSTAQGVTDDEIFLGMVAPFNGPAQQMGRDMRAGIVTYFEHINSQGGAGARKLRLISADDEYDPDTALIKMQELDPKVFAFIGNVGTPTAEKTMPYAIGKKKLFFGAFTGAKLLREDPPNRYVFNYRASYEQETEKIVHYLTDIKKLKPEEIAVFDQNDSYGDSGFQGVAKALRKQGIEKEKIVRGRYTRNTLQVDGAVAEILKHPEIRAIVMVPTAGPAARFIKNIKDNIKDAGRKEMIFTSVSFVNSKALAETLTQLGPDYTDGVIVTQVVPHPEAGSSIALEYRERLQKYHPDEIPSFTSLEGYIAAALLVEGLRRVGDTLDTESLVKALESIHQLELGLGTKLDFGPSDHQASRKIWGTVMDKSGKYRILDLDQ